MTDQYALHAERLGDFSARLSFDRAADSVADLYIDLIWLDENDEAKAGGDFIERRFGSRLLLVDLIDSRDLGVRVSPSARWQQLEEQQGFLLLVSQPSGSGGQRQLRGAAVWRRADRVAARLPRVPDLTVDAEFFNQPELWHLADVLGPLRTASDQRTNQDQRPPAAPHFDWLEVGGLRGFASDQRVHLAAPNGAVGSGLTVLVGANNAGKSTIVESFDALVRASQSGTTSFPVGRRNRHYSGGVRIALHRTDGQLASVSTIGAGSEARFSSSEGSEPYALDVAVVPSRRQFSAFFSRQSSASRSWGSSSGEYSRTQLREGFAGRLFELQRHSDRREVFNNLFARVLGRPVDWTIDLNDQGSYYLQFAEGDIVHSSEGLGEGLISLLFILDALHDSTPGSLTVIDEPELSLHPQYLRRLSHLIAEYALNRQVVYATHAPALVSWDHIANGAVVARVHKTSGQSVVSHPSRKTFDRVSKLRLDTHAPHTLGLEANEVFFLEDGIILLEGQEDVVYLPRVLRDLEMPALENVFGWGVGGAERVGPFLQLFQELGFSKVAVVLDNDKADLASELARSFHDYLVRTIPAPDIRTKPEQPAKAAKSGLLDAGNATVRPELAEAAANVFRDVADYLREGS